MRTRKITECAIMIALAAVLHMIKLFSMPQGGAVTLASMVPLIIISYRHGIKWGVLTASTFAFLNMVLGFYAPPAGDVLSYILVVLLDYVIAFGVLGLADLFRKGIGNRLIGLVFSTLIVCVFRFSCHFASGMLIWGVYAKEGQSVAAYSLIYNGPYMLVETIISVVVIVGLTKLIKQIVT